MWMLPRSLCSVQIMIVIFGVITICRSQLNLSSTSCFKPTFNSRTGKIVGGTNAKHSPYIVPLMRHGGNFCGSTIVADRYLLSAGHCLCNSKNKFLKPTQIKAFVGVERLSDIKSYQLESRSEDDFIDEIFVNQIIVHPDYVCGKPENDLALLQLKYPIKFNKKVQPVCLANEESGKRIDEFGIISGWGYTNEKQELGSKPNHLQEAVVPVWNNQDCQDSYRSQNQKNVISDGLICAGERNGGVDSCWADSGGSMLSKTDGSLIGVISTGIGCARPHLPGIYQRVSKYTKWIKSHIV